MTRDELLQKLNEIEWEDLEFKESLRVLPKSVWETVSAFANTNGGWLILGVKQHHKDYEIAGVENAEKIEQDFLTTIRGRKFNSPLTVQAKKYLFDNKMVLAFYISESGNKPVYFNSKANTFLRSGSGDQKATDAEIDALFRDSAFGAKDKELTHYFLADLDSNSIDVYRKYLDLYHPDHRYSGLSDLTLMRKLQVIKEDKVTIGGLLFFGKQDDINDLLIDFRIDYLEIPGTSYKNSTVRYSFRLSEEENLFMFYFAIIERLSKKIDIPFKMTASGFSTNIQPQFIAIREALVNLLMHSDYFSTQKPRIRVFSDRIEFMNPGGLPKDIVSILKEDFSKPRNPIIARIFRIIGLAESAGSGFTKMFNGWFSGHNVKPDCFSELDYYSITFPFTPVNVPVNVPVNRVEKIIEFIENKKNITISVLADKLSVNEKTIKRDIEKLKTQHRLKRVGSDKSGYWKILINDDK